MQITYCLDDLDKVAAKIIEKADSKTLLFVGEMGVGKTTLIKAIVKQLGSKDPVSSPTFSLVNEYKTPSGPIYHFDFHRIETEEEAFDMGFEEYLFTEAWKLIEWPKKVENLLQGKTTRLILGVLPNQNRKIILREDA